jgi:PAS domain S-box-containing protein
MNSNQFIKNLSIKNKIIAIVLFVGFIAMSAGFTFIVTWDINKLKEDTQSSLVLSAKLIGDYCVVPLTFGDKMQATEALSRLKFIESVEAGLLFDENGTLFSTYPATLKDTSSLGKQIVIFKDKQFYIKEPVYFQGKVLGTIIIKANSKSLADRKKKLTMTISALILILVSLSYLLAVRAQKLISTPILKLTESIASISQSQDFTIQLQALGDDEVGVLYQQFNKMLSQLLKWQTERDLAEKEITFLAHVFKNINENVTITDLSDKIIFVNQTLLRTYGYSESELIGQNINILRSPLNPNNIIKEIQPLTLKGGWQGELLNKRKDGSEFPIYLRTTIILDKANQPVALVGVSNDITRQKSEERELKLHRDHLEELVKQRTAELEIEKENAQSADRLKSAFLATMSHELRTPLNSIIGFSGILMQERPGPLNYEQKKQLGMVQSSAKHLLSLINDVLDISKIEAGQLKLNIELFNVPEVIMKAVETNKPLAEKKNIQINVSISQEVSDIVSDKLRVQQVSINLINNAIKFTDSGSVSIECLKSNNFVIIKVKDSGIGIEKNQIGLLFKPFTQVDTGLTRKHEGTGLGLSICKKLLDMLNGSIEVESEFGTGSIFTVKLPINKA